MRIKNEDFEKLKQSDRIELMLRMRALKDNTSYYFLSFLGGMINLILLLGIFGLTYYIAFNKYTVILAMLPIMQVLRWAFPIIIILDFVTLIMFYRDRKRIESRFFKEKIEVKK